MYIQIASDLHIDKNGNWNDSKNFPISIPKNSKEIILVIAGDLSPDIDNNLYVLNFYSKYYKYVIFVLGNHEYDYLNVDNVYKKYQRRLKEESNIHVLERNSIIIDDVIFYGCTGWGNALLTPEIQHEIDDFQNIENFNPEKCVDLFNKSKEWVRFIFDNNFQLENRNKKTVLITHFAFCMKSLNFHNSKLNGYFVNEVLELLYNLPDVYIHGHTHQYLKYVYNEKTKVYCNAFGYNSGPRPVTKFNPELIIEV